MKTNVKNQRLFKYLLIAFFCFSAVVICFAFCSVEAQAKTITITEPSQLRDINWKNKGFGPGNTYVIGADMTLGDGDYATCTLTKGKFTIDFNGHTVQNANNALGVFSLRGAEVIMKDSKVSANKPSVRSYGAGAIDMTAGKLTISSGNYVGLSNGTNNPCGLHVGGGTCVVNGGFIGGDTIGADCSGGGTLYINGGTFQTNFWFALADFGNGNIHVSKGKFIGGQTTYGFHFALGAYSPNAYYDFSKWLANGSSFSTDFQTGYWNLQSSVTAYPTISNYYAVAYETPTLSVTSSVKKPAATSISSLKAGRKSFTVKWKKKTNISGYQIQYATNKNFSKGKTVTVTGAKNASKTVKKLKGKKKYYVRVRTYKKFNGTSLYSKWSASKTVTTKK